MRIRYLLGPLLCLAVIALTGCGNNSTSQALFTGKTIITGLAMKGPIDTGTVKVFAIRNGVVDTSAPIGQGKTDAGGNFTVTVGDYQGPVMVEVAGGLFIDEVSGATVNLLSPLRAAVSDTTIGTNIVAVTPLTELSTRRTQGHTAITPDVINESNNSVSAIFNLADIISTLPVAAGTDDNQKKYAASCGSFSQLANDRLATSGGSLDDALKDVMDDMGNEAEYSGLSDASITMITDAITEFNSSGKNQTGVDAPPVTPVNGILKISTSGSANIGALDMTVSMPSGVEVAADPDTGEAAAGAVVISGVASSGHNELTTKVTPASDGSPGKLTISIINNNGFGSGECVTVDFHVATGEGFPANADAFTVTADAKDVDGTPLSGVTAVVASMGVL